MFTFYQSRHGETLNAAKASQLLLVSQIAQEPKPQLRPAQWVVNEQSGGASLPVLLLLPLLRTSFKVDKELFDEICGHPKVKELFQDKGKEESGAPSANKLEGAAILDALEKRIGASAASSSSEEISKAVLDSFTFALTVGTLKDVFLVILSLLHLDSKEAMEKAIGCLRQLSFVEQSKFMEEALTEKMLMATVEQEDKIAQVVGVAGVNPEVARKALQLSNWAIEAAINVLMDDPSKVETALEKDVLEQDQRNKEAQAQQQKRLESLKSVKDKNKATQVSSKKCFTGTKIQSEDTMESVVAPSSMDHAFAIVAYHLDRLLVEMDCPVKLPDAPIDKLQDNHILSFTFLAPLLEAFVTKLRQLNFGQGKDSSSETEEQKMCAYVLMILLRLLKKNIAAFGPVIVDESNKADVAVQKLFQKQRPFMSRIGRSMLDIIRMAAASSKPEVEDEPLQQSQVAVGAPPASGGNPVPEVIPLVSDLVLGEALACFQAGFHSFYANAEDRNGLIRQLLSASSTDCVFSRIERIVWKEFSRDFSASALDAATLEQLLAEIFKWEKENLLTATITPKTMSELGTKVTSRYGTFTRLVYHQFHKVFPGTTAETKPLLQAVSSTAVQVLSHLVDVFSFVASSKALSEEFSNALRNSGSGKVGAPVVLALSSLEHSQLLRMPQVFPLAAKLLDALVATLEFASQEWVVVLAEYVTALIGEIGYALVRGAQADESEVSAQANTALSSEFFSAGRLEDSDNTISTCVAAARKLCPWVLNKGPVNDLLKMRSGPEIDDMIVNVSAAIMHHCRKGGELVALAEKADPESSPPTWMVDSFRSAVALKLTAMKDLQNARSKSEDDQANPVTLGTICAGYSTRARFVLGFHPCCSKDSKIEEEKEAANHIVQFVTSSTVTLEQLSVAFEFVDVRASMRKAGFDLFRETVSSLGKIKHKSLPLHILRYVGQTFAGRDNVGVTVLNSFEVCRQSLKNQVREAFEKLFVQLVQLVSAGKEQDITHALLECLVVKLEEDDLPVASKSNVLSVLQEVVSRSREKEKNLRDLLVASGTSFSLAEPDPLVGKAEDVPLQLQEVTNAAMRVLTITVAQIAMLSSSKKDAKNPLLSTVSNVLLEEMSKAIPTLSSASVADHGDTLKDDCQQIISSVKQFDRDMEGMYVPELIRSSDSRPNVTFSLWIKVGAESAQGTFGIFYTGPSGAQYRGLLLVNRCLQYQHTSINGIQTVLSSEVLPVERWVHVVVTTRARRLRLYVSGKQAAESKMESTAVDVSGYPLYVGSYFGCPARNFSQGFFGLISNFRYLPRYVTVEEVAKLHSSGPIVLRADDRVFQLVALLHHVKSVSNEVDQRLLCDPGLSLLFEMLQNGTFRVQRTVLRLLSHILPQLDPASSFAKIQFLTERSQTVMSFLMEFARSKLIKHKSKDVSGAVNMSSRILGLLAEVIVLFRHLVASKWSAVIWDYILQFIDKGKSCFDANGLVAVQGAESTDYLNLMFALYVVGGHVSVPRPGSRVILAGSAEKSKGVVESMNLWVATAGVRLDSVDGKPSFYSSVNAESIRTLDPDDGREQSLGSVPSSCLQRCIAGLEVLCTKTLVAPEKSQPVDAQKLANLTPEEKQKVEETMRKEREEATLRRVDFLCLCFAFLRVLRSFSKASEDISKSSSLLKTIAHIALEEANCSGDETLEEMEHQLVVHQRRVIDMFWCNKETPAPPIPEEEKDEDGSGGVPPPPPPAPTGKNAKKQPAKSGLFGAPPPAAAAAPAPAPVPAAAAAAGGALFVPAGDNNNNGGLFGAFVFAPAENKPVEVKPEPPVEVKVAEKNPIAESDEGLGFGLFDSPEPAKKEVDAPPQPPAAVIPAAQPAAQPVIPPAPAPNQPQAAPAPAPAPAAAPKGGSKKPAPPTKEEKLARLRELVPNAEESDYQTAMLLNKDDVDKSVGWVKEKVQSRILASVRDAFNRIYPDSWCSSALAKCGNDPKVAIAWLPGHVKELVDNEADMMDVFSGEDMFRYRYFDQGGNAFGGGRRPAGYGGGFGGFGGFDFGSGLNQFNAGGGMSHSKLLRHSFDRVLSQLKSSSEVCIIFSCRKILLNCLVHALKSGTLGKVVAETVTPQALVKLMRLSLFRGPELILANANETKNLFDSILQLVWKPGSPLGEEYRKAIVEDIVLQLYKLPNPEYASFMSDKEDRITRDSDAARIPCIHFIEWTLTRVFASPALGKGEIDLIFGGLVAAMRSGHMSVKSSVFSMISGILRKGLENKALNLAHFIAALPVEKIFNHAKSRLAVERCVDIRASRTRYLATLLDLVATLQYLTDLNKVEKCSLRAPILIPLDFASTSTSVTVAWLHMQKPKTESNFGKKRSVPTYFVEMKEAVGNGAWRNVYEGTSSSMTRENLAPCTCYAFRIRVKRGASETDWSPVAYVCTMGVAIELDKDPKKRGEGIAIGENGRTLDKTDPSQSWRSIVSKTSFTSGLHYWEVHIDAAEWGTVAFGVAHAKKLNLTNTCGHEFANFRGLIGGAETLFGEFYGAGNIMGILLDMNTKQVSYFKDGKPLGVAFSNIKIDEGIPIFSLKQTGSRMTLMPESFSCAGVPTEAVLADALEVSNVLMSMADARKELPMNFVKRSFNGFRMWIKQIIQRHTTRAGFELDVNISDLKLAPFNFRHGDRISSPEGERIVVGVYGEYLWTKPAKGDGKIWFWSKKYLDEWKAEIAVLEKTSWVPSPVIIQEVAFHKFEEFVHGLTMQQDAAIVAAFNKAAAAMDQPPFNVPMSVLLEHAKTSDALKGVSLQTIACRAAFIREFNNSVASLLTMIAAEDREQPWSLAGLVSRFRDLLFLHTKEAAYGWLLEHTTQTTHLRDDEYTDPSNLMTIAVNREKAQRYAEDPDLDKRKRGSLFYQVFERFRGLGIGRQGGGAASNLRQKYTGILDAGQSRTFKITFQNEGVTDNGGPYRELFSHFCAELQSEVLQLLTPCPNARAQIGDHQEAFVFNHRIKDKTDMDLFHFMGQMIGIALRCDIPMEMRWPRLVWKRMVGLPVTVEDLRAVDQNLFQMLDDIRAATDETLFKNTFSDVFFAVHTFDGQEQIELIPGGAEIQVDFARRLEYVDKVIAFKLTEGASQMNEMIIGLATIIPTQELCWFSPDELERKVCGAPCVDIGVLKSNVVYDGIAETEEVVKWLWEVLTEMDMEQRALFLQFVWARSRLPLLPSGMIMKFKIQGAPDSVNVKPDDHLPLAHTCFFSISLPNYSSKAILQSKLLYAIKNCRAMDSDFRLHNSELHLTRSM